MKPIRPISPPQKSLQPPEPPEPPEPLSKDFGAFLFTAVMVLALTLVILVGTRLVRERVEAYVGEPSTSATESEGSRSAGLNAATARRQLAALPVFERRPYRDGYERGCGPGQGCSFGPAGTADTSAPSDRFGCGTRDEVLAAQLDDVRRRAGSRCVVESGVLRDPYTGRTIQFRRGGATSPQVEVDHVVALRLAWDLGAWRWPIERRVAFANDEDLVLLAVGGGANDAKADRGPAEWMPPNRSTWCAYDARFVAILAQYGLPVTAADKRAITGVLTHC